MSSPSQRSGPTLGRSKPLEDALAVLERALPMDPDVDDETVDDIFDKELHDDRANARNLARTMEKYRQRLSRDAGSS